MIELNEKTQQDFLSREWAKKLIDAGIDMSDAKYIIAKDRLSMLDPEPDLTDYAWYKDSTEEVYDVCPTYTFAEILSKLKGNINNLNIDGKSYSGDLAIDKRDLGTVVTYAFCYSLKHIDYNEGKEHYYSTYLWSGKHENPLEALASLLIKCKERITTE